MVYPHTDDHTSKYYNWQCMAGSRTRDLLIPIKGGVLLWPVVYILVRPILGFEMLHLQLQWMVSGHPYSSAAAWDLQHLQNITIFNLQG